MARRDLDYETMSDLVYMIKYIKKFQEEFCKKKDCNHCLFDLPGFCTCPVYELSQSLCVQGYDEPYKYEWLLEDFAKATSART